MLFCVDRNCDLENVAMSPPSVHCVKLFVGAKCCWLK